MSSGPTWATLGGNPISKKQNNSNKKHPLLSLARKCALVVAGHNSEQRQKAELGVTLHTQSIGHEYFIAYLHLKVKKIKDQSSSIGTKRKCYEHPKLNSLKLNTAQKDQKYSMFFIY